MSEEVDGVVRVVVRLDVHRIEDHLAQSKSAVSQHFDEHFLDWKWVTTRH